MSLKCKISIFIWLYVCICHILCLIIIIHHTRHHFITRTTSKHKWFHAGTKQVSVPSFGNFIKSKKVQCARAWVSPRRRGFIAASKPWNNVKPFSQPWFLFNFAHWISCFRHENEKVTGQLENRGVDLRGILELLHIIVESSAQGRDLWPCTR